MNVKAGRQAERSEATRTALVATARRLFGERGYADVGTEEIVRKAGVTRGALYHHFGATEALFEAVFHEVETEVTQRIAAELLESPDPLSALRKGTELFLDACLMPEVRQVTLIDAPTVFGWQRWRELDLQYGLGLVQAGLQGAMETGAIADQPLKPLAHVLMGALIEGGMLVARADDREVARREVESTLGGVLDALRVENR